MAEIVPQCIERVGEKALQMTWSDGHVSVYLWNDLRGLCPCAACTQKPQGLPLGVPADLQALEVSPVGRYALHVRFTDGHTTGIYTFAYLRKNCLCRECC